MILYNIFLSFCIGYLYQDHPSGVPPVRISWLRYSTRWFFQWVAVAYTAILNFSEWTQNRKTFSLGLNFAISRWGKRNTYEDIKQLTHEERTYVPYFDPACWHELTNRYLHQEHWYSSQYHHNEVRNKKRAWKMSKKMIMHSTKCLHHQHWERQQQVLSVVIGCRFFLNTW